MERNLEKKRDDYINWTEYFMATAFLAAKRSKDPCSQVGACIVNKENKIVGVGYNGFPIGCDDDKFPWSKSTDDPLKSKYTYVCHAEMNAIINKNCSDVKGCTIFVALFPCNECAKIIIQSGIIEVVYMSDKHKDKPQTQASKIMFDAVGIKYTQFVPKQKQIIIDFTEIDWNNTNDNSIESSTSSSNSLCKELLLEKQTSTLSEIELMQYEKNSTAKERQAEWNLMSKLNLN